MERHEFENEVLDWLAEGMPRNPIPYVMLLSLPSGDLGKTLLANLRTVATRLRDRPDDWRSLIRANNWRPTLVGCSAVLLERDTRFFADLLDRFLECSWVAPQLSVALGLIHADRVVADFELILRESTVSTHVKRTFSAYAVLKRLEPVSVPEFESSELFRGVQGESPEFLQARSESRIALDVVQSQWNFWISHYQE